MKIKNYLISFFVLISIFSFIGVCRADSARPLEVPLPGVGDAKEITTTPLLPDYIKYIFTAAVGISGLIAFVMLTWGGIEHLMAAGNTSKMGEAKDRMFSAFIGIGILLSSYIILRTIDPRLVFINPEAGYDGISDIPMGGVSVCEKGTTNCQNISSRTADLGDFSGKELTFKVSPLEGERYGILLHKDKDFKGNCTFFLTESPPTIGYYELLTDAPSTGDSVEIVALDDSKSGSVKICENKNCDPRPDIDYAAYKEFSFNSTAITAITESQVKNISKGSIVAAGINNLADKKYENGDNIKDGVSSVYENQNINTGVSAIELNGLSAILFSDVNYSGICDLFTNNDSNLDFGKAIPSDKARSILMIKTK